LNISYQDVKKETVKFTIITAGKIANIRQQIHLYAKIDYCLKIKYEVYLWF
jgi:hypothetical protein